MSGREKRGDGYNFILTFLLLKLYIRIVDGKENF